MSPAQAKDTAVWTNPVLWSLGVDSWMLCTSTWVGDGEEPQESSRWIWAQRETPNSCFYNVFLYVFMLCVQRLQRQAGWHAVWGFAFCSRPWTAHTDGSDGPGNPEENDGLWGLWWCSIFRPYLRKCHIISEDVPFFSQIWRSLGEKRSPREQVAVRLSSNHHSWTQAPPNPILYTIQWNIITRLEDKVV